MKPYTGRVLSQVEVEERICSILEEMESRTEDFAQLSEDAANAEADYRRIHALTTLAVLRGSEAKMSVGERDAKVDASTVEEHRTFLIKQAARNSCRESLTSMREQLNALRTLCANIRGQV